MSGERRFFRRDRLTGHIAIGVVGVLCAAAVVFGVGMASAKYHLSDVGGWLTSVHRGELVHVNGLSGKVDGKVTLSGSTGHPMKVIQQGGVVLIVDEVTGVVSRVDPAHLNVVQGATFRGAAGMQVVSGSGQAYALDQQKGSVQRLDPMTLATMGSPLGLTGPLGSAGIDATSVLWVPVPTNGQAAPVRSGQAAQPIGIGRAGDDLSLTIAAGAPVITDFTSAQAVIIGKNGTQIKVRLPSTVAQVGKGSVLAPASTDGQLVPLLAGNSLVVLNTGSGSISSVALKLPPKHKLAAPQALGQKVYIPDQSSGDLIVYDSATNRMAPQVPVTGQAGPLDAFVKDGLLWVNGPDSAKGVVVDGAGGHKPIQKYTPDVPGSQKSPVPRVGVPAGGASGRPKPGGGGPTAPSHPRLPTKPPVTPPTHKPDPPKVTPPNAPTNLRATPQPDGTIKVDFQPGGGGDATGYKLLTSDGLTATPDKIGANGPDYTFTVNGGTCGQEYQFAVAALYHNRDHDSEVDSEYTTPTLSCTEPDAPSNITGTGTAQGAKIDWQAPPNADNKKVTYAVNVTGPKTGSNPNLTGTSVTFGDIWKNGTYTVKVTASNPAGTKSDSKTVTLKGPSVNYVGQHAGNPGDKSWLHQTPSNDDTNVYITDYNGQNLLVDCQKIGGHFAHSNGDPYYAGNLWDYIHYQGKEGYIIGYLVATPKQPDWQNYNGLPLWECAD
ncbi:fibronectin type III domain-containing protein [Actinoallomurus iriomotensis]|uniref:Fibronectin type-III domain-containing protein n=1 Tax=Actinoallomurus iriomotensis TaxID=478107 RepID=A0A9W6RD51_9ACTN|nr:fibronectin type III domain-containing protein [Actinoallomurus iriomotensis]GLY73816.1 hypothetical protein Airi01_020830 [Actinoallomurus iriomotensis]